MKFAPSIAHNLLFSMDLEEFYPADPGKDTRSTPLPVLVARYLDLLENHDARGTFFVVGDVARRYPDLLQTIAAAGHELGCHGDVHRTLDQFTPNAFAEDLRANRDAVETVTGIRVVGFRAPILSLTENTAWAYSVLASEGFTYSSSVLPARNPLYGWPDFGRSPRRVEGVWEIPVTLVRLFRLPALPVYCGTYFRILPWWLARRGILRLKSNIPIVSYFHPYDIDHQQPWAMHSGVDGKPIMNLLLFLRRASLPARIAQLLQACPARDTYRNYVEQMSVSP